MRNQWSSLVHFWVSQRCITLISHESKTWDTPVILPTLLCGKSEMYFPWYHTGPKLVILQWYSLVQLRLKLSWVSQVLNMVLSHVSPWYTYCTTWGNWYREKLMLNFGVSIVFILSSAHLSVSPLFHPGLTCVIHVYCSVGTHVQGSLPVGHSRCCHTAHPWH